MEEKKLLIVTYYWPPLGGSGVQRWLKFVKYLPEFGVIPYVFTPENPSFDIKDESLMADVPAEAEVIRFPIWEPYEMFFRISGMFGGNKSNKPTHLLSGKNQSLLRRLSTWVRGNLLIPDPRVFWVRPSVKFLKDFIRDNGIETIITTGPPHSIHLIGYHLKKHNHSLRWMADFRDPWSEWGFLDSLGVRKPARAWHKRLEKKVLTTADILTTITPFYVKRFEALSGRKVHLLTNGFDESDFAGLSPVRTEKFVIRHVGIVNEKCNPRPFMNAVREAMQADPSFAEAVQVDFVGEVHPMFRDFVEKDPMLKPKTTFTPSVPHKALISMYNNSSVLLLVLEGYRDAEGYMPGKLFEYLATGLPIVGVGPVTGDASELLHNAGQQRLINGKDVMNIRDILLDHFRDWKSETDGVFMKKGVKSYSRKRLTQSLIEILYA